MIAGDDEGGQGEPLRGRVADHGEGPILEAEGPGRRREGGNRLGGQHPGQVRLPLPGDDAGEVQRIDLFKRIRRLGDLDLPPVADQPAARPEAELGIEGHRGRVPLDDLQHHRPLAARPGLRDRLPEHPPSHAAAAQLGGEPHGGDAAVPTPPRDQHHAGGGAVPFIDAADVGIEVLGAEPALVGLGGEVEGDDIARERAAERRRHLGGRALRDRAGGEGGCGGGAHQGRRLIRKNSRYPHAIL